jgi:LemA protein
VSVVALVVVAVAVLLFVVLFNRLVRARAKVRQAWAQIDVQLRRRRSLIPELVATAKGLMQHERALLDRLVHARQAGEHTQASVEARAAVENEITHCLHALVAVVEAHPRLRSNEHMAMLLEDLTSTENRVALARQRYNDAVSDYNTARDKVPANLLAMPLGFTRADGFVLDDIVTPSA